MREPDKDQLRSFLTFLDLPAGQLLEICGIDNETPKQVDRSSIRAVGIYDDLDEAVAAAAELDREDQWSVYVGFNPRRAGTNRPTNTMEIPPGLRGGDEEILRIRAVRVDVDPVSPTRPALDEEGDACRRIALQIRDHVSPDGASAVCATGNGCSLTFLTDLPATKTIKNKLKNFLHHLAAEYSTEDVEIDKGVSNFSGLTALPGTWKRKLKDIDDYTEDRPRRMVRIEEIRQGTNPGALAAYLATVPDMLSTLIDVEQLDLPTDSPVATFADLCPGWLKIYREVPRAPSTPEMDLSASGIIHKLVRALHFRVGMTLDEIILAVFERDRLIGHHYGNLEHATGDVRRILEKTPLPPSCETARAILGDDAPCNKCPEWLFRPPPDTSKYIVVRKKLDTYSRPDPSRRREDLGSDLDEVRKGLDVVVEDFLDYLAEHHEPGAIYEEVFLLRLGAGIGKTHVSVDVLNRFLSRPDAPRFILFTDTYKNALRVMAMLDPSHGVRLFHPKEKPKRVDVEGYCENLTRHRKLRNQGVENEYQEICKNCRKVRACRYRVQFLEECSYVAVHDLAPALIGEHADRGNLPWLALFDENPRRLYQPELKAITDLVMKNVALAYEDSSELALPIISAAYRHTGPPTPTVGLLDNEERECISTMLQVPLPRGLSATARLFIQALREDLQSSRPPHNVWTPPLKYNLEGQPHAVVVQKKQMQLHHEVLVTALDATAHDHILGQGLGREVVTDTETVPPRCQLFLVPVNTSKGFFRRDRGLRRDVERFITHRIEEWSEDEPLGLIGYKDFIQSMAKKYEGKPLVSAYFGNLRGTNEFVENGVQELIIVGVPIPHLTDFGITASTFILQHHDRLPELDHGSHVVHTGLEWEGHAVGVHALSYPDKDLNTLFEQETAAEMYQAAFRIRPLEGIPGKRIWLFGRQPVWDIPVTEVLRLPDALARIGLSPQGRGRGRPRNQRDAVQRAFDASKGCATISDLAKQTGASVSTVKRALREFREESATQDAQDEE